jgi:hypothetical protein
VQLFELVPLQVRQVLWQETSWQSPKESIMYPLSQVHLLFWRFTKFPILHARHPVEELLKQVLQEKSQVWQNPFPSMKNPSSQTQPPLESLALFLQLAQVFWFELQVRQLLLQFWQKPLPSM